MADSKYFGIPFGTSGDKATIPEAVQPSGAISYTQGFGPDYERDPATDPLAKRVPRDETNELYFQVTNALKFLQLYGTPEWYAVDDAGNPVSYPLSARVRYNAGAGMQAWRSLVATNTATPGSDATKWTLDNPFDIATLEASLTEALAGTLGTKLITPRRLASASQRGAWNYAVAAGTANALTATLSPAPAALSAGMTIALDIPNANTSGTVTLNVNGLGEAPVYRRNSLTLAARDIKPGLNEFVFDGTNWRLTNPSFGASAISSSGYVDLPGGITIQWGQASTSGGFAAVTFPKAFSAGVFAINSTDRSAAGWGPSNASFIGTSISGATTTSVGFWSVTWNGSSFQSSSVNFSWIAIGPT